MLNFLKLISPTHPAIKLSIGKRRLNCCDGLVAEPGFADFMQIFDQKIRWIYANCANLDFEKFYMGNEVILLNLSLLQIQHVGDKV